MRIIEVKESVQPNKSDGYKFTLSAVINPYDNGGESVTLSVDVFDNGDGFPEGLFTNTEIQAQCYGVHSSSITLFGVAFGQLAEAVKKIEDKIEEKMRV